MTAEFISCAIIFGLNMILLGDGKNIVDSSAESKIQPKRFQKIWNK